MELTKVLMKKMEKVAKLDNPWPGPAGHAGGGEVDHSLHDLLQVQNPIELDPFMTP